MSKNKSKKKIPRAVSLPKKNPSNFPIIFALVLGLAVRVFYLIFSQKSPFYEPLLLDPAYYHQWAQRILNGDWVGDPVFYGLPLYPFFLALCYKVFNGSLLAVKIIQAALGIVTLFFIYKIGEKIASRIVGIIAVFLAALYGPLFFHEGILIPEALSLPLYAISFYLAVSFEEEPTFRKGVLLGLSCGLAALTKAGIIPFVFIFIGLNLIREIKGKKGMYTAIFSMLAVFLLTLVPVTLHNFILGKDRVLLTSHSGFNFYIGNNPKAEGVFTAPEGVGSNVESQIADSKAVAEKELGRELKPSEVSKYWSDKAWDYIKNNSVDFLRLCLRKVALFFDAREISDVDDYVFCAIFNPALRVPWLNFSILGPLFLLGSLVSFALLRHKPLIYSWTLSYLAGIILFFVNARYRLPLLSIMFPVAAVAVVDLYEKAKNKAWFGLGLRIAVLLLGIALTQARLVGIDRAHDYVNAGDAESIKSDYDQAESLYREALKIDPQFVKANQAMGVLLSRLGKTDEAMEYYQKALQEDPNNYQSHNNIGLWYDKEGNLVEAKNHFLKAIELKPTSSQAHNNLGMVYGKEGEAEKAVKEFETSLKLDPNNARTETNLGLVLYHVGKIDQAKEAWESALKIDPGFELAKKALTLLKERQS